jgi:3-oxoadipate enol-lactonase
VSVADVNGTRLWYEVEGEGPGVVLLHEGIGDARMWDDQWKPFSASYRTVRMDFRGFGRSELPGGPFSLADDVLALVDDLGLGRVALVGGSVGANVALEVALTAPDRVTALVIAPPGMVTDERSQEVVDFGEAEDAALDRGDLDEAVRLNLDLWVAGPGRDLAEVEGPLVECVAEMQRRAFELQVPAYEQEPAPEHQARFRPLADHLGDVVAPTLAIVGDLDVADIADAADSIEASIPGARKVVMERVAHLPNMERPDEYNRLVLGFLQEQLAD